MFPPGQSPATAVQKYPKPASEVALLDITGVSARNSLNCPPCLPTQILRLPGIYGPGRSVLNLLQQGRARLIDKPGQVFCRIHVEDIAGACWHLMHRAEQGDPPTPGDRSVVNVVDDLPGKAYDDFAHLKGIEGNQMIADGVVQWLQTVQQAPATER